MLILPDFDFHMQHGMVVHLRRHLPDVLQSLADDTSRPSLGDPPAEVRFITGSHIKNASR